VVQSPTSTEAEVLPPAPTETTTTTEVITASESPVVDVPVVVGEVPTSTEVVVNP
jgi:hypothetical protein